MVATELQVGTRVSFIPSLRGIDRGSVVSIRNLLCRKDAKDILTSKKALYSYQCTGMPLASVNRARAIQIAQSRL
jgi:hypothetical protein